MEELVVQNYNHPCIAVWGLSNEITVASTVNTIEHDGRRSGHWGVKKMNVDDLQDRGI